MKDLIVKIFLILLLACMIFSAGSCKPKSAPEATHTDSLSIPNDTTVEVLEEAADKTYAEPEITSPNTLPKEPVKKEKPTSNKPKPKNDCIGTPKPDCICTRQYDPVCGCNGKTYGNACEAGCDGIKQFTKGECK